MLRDAAELVLAMYSLWEKNSFSEGADVKGTLFLFFWLKSGTDRQPDGDSRGNISGRIRLLSALGQTKNTP